MTAGAPPRPVLGVERSLTGRRWVGPGPEAERRAEALAQQTALPLPAARILAARGVAAAEVPAFLEPRLRDLMPDPSRLKDMDAAAVRLARAVVEGARIAIFADYDVDGAASAALLMDWLAAQGRQATLYVPDRVEEGYGPNVPAMERLAAGHDLIVCVDCGTVALEPVAAARARGAEVVILDHHQAGAALPEAQAIVNPNRADEDGTLGHLAAAGVVFMALVAANRELRRMGREGPDLLPLLDLVALATVADVVPLKGVNRAFVRQGLRIMAGGTRPGLAALARVAGLEGPPSAGQLGFALGPRINAGGRVGRAELGARLLTARDPLTAHRLAEELERLNQARQQIEAQVLAEALAQVEARGGAAGPLAWAAGQGWHPGVVGIVAARLKEATGRPAVVIGLDGREGKGSGRSVPGIDLGRAVRRLAEEGLLLRGGGHAMAAGLALEPAKLEPAMARLAELLPEAGGGEARELTLAGVLTPAAATLELAETLERLGPFGAGAPAPRFALPMLRVQFAREVGTGHVKAMLVDDAGNRIDAIAFRAAESGLAEPLSRIGARLHVAGRLEVNSWNGRCRVQLRLEDAAPAEAGAPPSPPPA